jgi:diaminopimelate epimerase
MFKAGINLNDFIFRNSLPVLLNYVNYQRLQYFQNLVFITIFVNENKHAFRMNISFDKYHGTGNDFIIIDIRNHAIPDAPDIIAHLCDRHHGIGADGLIMMDLAEGFDFAMLYFNADGHKASLCGNGGRCITAYAHKLGMVEHEASFKAADGAHRAKIISTDRHKAQISLEMNDVTSAEWENESIFLDTGSPHLVILCEDLASLDVHAEGRKIRNASQFSPHGTNVNFIEEVDGVLKIRTYERGVEAETLSCGTGVTAAAIAWALKNNITSTIELMAIGGLLKVSFDKSDKGFTNIRLEGPAEYVFSGQIEI